MQADAQPGDEEDIAAEDFNVVNLEDTEEDNFEGEDLESVDAKTEDFDELDILGND